MITEATHMAAIRERPDDPGPRLVFADWLDERGEGERAEFVWLGLEFGRLSEVDKTCPHLDNYGRNKPRWEEGICQCGGCVIYRRQLELFAAVRQHRVPCGKCVGGAVPNHYAMGRCRDCDGEGFTLAEKMNGQAWFGTPLGGEIGVKCERCRLAPGSEPRDDGETTYFGSNGKCKDCHGIGRVVKDLTVQVPFENREHTYDGVGRCCGDILYTVSGGCLVSVACTLAQFVGEPCWRCRGEGIAAPYTSAECPQCHGIGYTGGIARPLFERFAVKNVVLKGKQPRYNGASWMWFRDGATSGTNHVTDICELPAVIFSKLAGGQQMGQNILGWDTAELADTALRLAAWKFGRRWAMLDVIMTIGGES